MTRGAPRVQYDRTYVLLPPDASKDWALAVIDATWDSKRYTIGGSADDAGVGDLEVRRVIAINPHRWSGDLRAFFEQYYPGIQYVPISADTPEQLRSILELPDPSGETSSILLWQKDPRWRDVRYGGGSCSTIGAQGCWLTCCAMALRYYRIDPNATPLSVDQTIGPAGYAGCQMKWSAMRDIGLRVVTSTTTASRVVQHLNARGVAFADVISGEGKHFVLVTMHDPNRGDYYAYDPLMPREGWLSTMYSSVDSWRLVSPLQPSALLVGLHDEAGARWMERNGLRGVCLVHRVVQEAPVPLDFSDLQRAGITVICRLNWGYADGTGTMPPPNKLSSHLVALAQTMNQARGVAYFHPWNEPNNAAEWPAGYQLTWRYVLDAYNTLCGMVKRDVCIGPPPLDPYYGPGSDNGEWWRSILSGAARIDALFLHTIKTQDGQAATIWSTRKFTDPPLTWQYMNARATETYLQMIPSARRGIPVFVTEANPMRGWAGAGGEWIREAVRYARMMSLSGIVFYRYDRAGDQAAYGISDRADLLTAVAECARGS